MKRQEVLISEDVFKVMREKNEIIEVVDVKQENKKKIKFKLNRAKKKLIDLIEDLYKEGKEHEDDEEEEDDLSNQNYRDILLSEIAEILKLLSDSVKCLNPSDDSFKLLPMVKATLLTLDKGCLVHDYDKFFLKQKISELKEKNNQIVENKPVQHNVQTQFN